MPFFRKKPVVIEAIQWTGENYAEVLPFIGTEVEVTGAMGALIIHTLEGPMRAEPHDWVIRGIKGEFYPCKPDIFAATYEPV